jgi:ribosomal protein L19
MFSNLNKSLSILKNSNTMSTLNNFYKFKVNYLQVLQGKKKSVFDQAHFNPYHIYKKNQVRKPQDKFEDETYNWEVLPSPVREKNQELLELVEKEELAKIKKAGLKKDPIRLGDKIEVEYYHSITSGKSYKYRGVVVSLKRPNSLTYAFKFLTMVAGNYVMLEYPYYSPMLLSVKVVTESTMKKSDRRTKIYSVNKIKDFGNK